ncbi:indole-3-glycerol phosphate synthase [Halovivax gelatinilyticus]|uniref:indole-3-glycerol phosphate synthase n=1 Tax=Halovivax gelatinilyticus TaxID=2961597 RepID=UPI0020CA550D|nr:indole-3-glycerol phosphate synthase [Halovivax gelatinilyticus]
MTTTELAPPVRSILAAARNRSTSANRTVSVSPRSLPDAIERAACEGRVPVIAEVKPTSPTTDGVREADPAALAREMVAGGATALSVLTEPEHFGGSLEALEAVRAAVDVPVLRKDFLLSEAHLDAVRADLVLLIARFVDDLPRLVDAARSRGFQPLVEVHTREELHRALDAGAELVGINNRDLASLEVDLSTFERVTERTDRPGDTEDRRLDRRLRGVTVIAESGIATADDVRRMRVAGADALLVGSAIMDGDVERNTRRLVDADGLADSPAPANDGSEVDSA